MFNDLKKEDYKKLLPYFMTSSYGLCDYSLSSAIVWNNCIYPMLYEIDGDILVLKELKDNGSDGHLLMPLTLNGRDILPIQLLEISKHNDNLSFSRVPEDWLEKHKAEAESLFNISEESGYADYVYRTKDLAELAGHKYSKKRNLIAQFKKNTCALRDVKLEDINPQNAYECHELLNRMPEQDDTGHNLDLLHCERRAISNAMLNFNDLEMKGIMVKIDGKIEAFAAGSTLNKNTFSLNFEKANTEVKGLYQYLDENFAKKLTGHFEYINKESDLGKPGLKQAKESYFPMRLLRSFSLIPKVKI